MKTMGKTKDIDPTITAIMECDTDDDLRHIIHVLREELVRRKRLRLVQRIKKVATKLSETERQVLIVLANKPNAVVPLDTRNALTKTKLLDSNGHTTTILGRRVALWLKMQENSNA